MRRKGPLKRKAHINRKGQIKRGYTKRGTRSQRSLLNKADALAKAACLSIGHCQAASWTKRTPARSGLGEGGACWGSLSWCHLKSRRHRTIRHDPENCVCMCAGCHAYFHANGEEFYLFIESLYPGRWESLYAKLALNERPDYEKWIEYYAEKDKGE